MCVSVSNVTLHFFSACEPNILHSKAGRDMCRQHGDKRLVAQREQLMCISKIGREKE